MNNNNNKIDWKRKLTSRKLWIAFIGFIIPLCLAFGITEDTTTQIASIIMAGASCIAYVIGEGLVDHDNAGKNTNTTKDE